MFRATMLAVLALPGLCVAQSNEQLRQLLRRYDEEGLREHPEAATLRGRGEYNARWTDWSRGAIDRRARRRRAYRERIAPFLNVRLSEQDALSLRVFRSMQTLSRSTMTAS